ncbi:hypothetical protein CDQ84_13630 [Clostridium thermosuccinogenes]|uniref:Uncharacterized protein n=1 Tax=Clostridium thermosuccinogenes TaxID=84032 RepID=A0A2K2FAQ8_9CLOT|nr:hypothetical protein [Pseudoclostridium thermosuccinogenes]AUS97785.1 hypothetical protein CDO33_15850 [Pseudoclostridium thermosuccinogenes]PNT95879.1 hypothetical protein CDQ85_13565 [Pseudoclostridium thermosuccinogenes]PNT97219.1 hypothetical protein CDQ84_13630 [Pseudoclostridium thermosuccinogenes]
MPSHRYRAPMFNRRYYNQGFNSYMPAYPKSSLGSSEKDIMNDEEKINDGDAFQKDFRIPMPNEIDAEVSAEADANVPSEAPSSRKYPKKQSFFDVLKGRIHPDDIILIVLIFLLIDNGLKDEFLLILLLYIFLF